MGGHVTRMEQNHYPENVLEKITRREKERLEVQGRKEDCMIKIHSD
jgi:hypothetical protein